MSGIQLTYTINDSKPLAMLQRLEDFNARAMLDEIGGYLDSEVDQRFKAGVDKDGNEWKQGETSFFSFKTWEGQRYRHLQKGDTVIIDGKLKQERWEKEGQKHSKIVIITRSIVKIIREKPQQNRGFRDGLGDIEQHIVDSETNKPVNQTTQIIRDDDVPF